jgi:hypothetical protein
VAVLLPPVEAALPPLELPPLARPPVLPPVPLDAPPVLLPPVALLESSSSSPQAATLKDAVKRIDIKRRYFLITLSHEH